MFLYVNKSKSLHSVTIKPTYKVVGKSDTVGRHFVSVKLTNKQVTQLLLSGEKIVLNHKVAKYLAYKRGFYEAVLKQLDRHADDVLHYSDKIIRARKPEMKQKWKGMRGVCHKQYQQLKQLRNQLIRTKSKV